MKVIVAGSRSISSRKLVERAITASGFEVTELVSGGAPGVDTMGEVWAANMGIPVRRFPAPWKFAGAFAGRARNEAMARYADALVAIWDGKSKGTKDMIERARACGLRVYVERQPLPQFTP